MNEQDLLLLEQMHQQDAHEEIVHYLKNLSSDQQQGYEYYSLLGRALNNLSRYEEACEAFEKVAEQGADQALWHYRLGFALFYADREEEAKQALLKSLELNPSDGDVWEILDMACEMLGEETPLPPPEGAVSQRNTLPLQAYTMEEMQAVEEHIETYFGTFENVFHEIYSPDIHVDLVVIPPVPERNFYTITTLGMGAHRMNVPSPLQEEGGYDRGEMMICLPPDWDLESENERWYWPLRLLKVLARMPLEEDSWLGWGHSIGNQGSFAGDTRFCGCVLSWPYKNLGQDGSAVCLLPDGDRVIFYQVIPLFGEELEFKISAGADALFRRFGGKIPFLLDSTRPNVALARPIELWDFEEGDYSSWEGYLSLWGEYGVWLRVDLPDDEDKRTGLRERIPSIREEMDWLSGRWDGVITAILEAELVEQICRTLEQLPTDEEGLVCLPDGERVSPTFTPDMLEESLHLERIYLSYETDYPEIGLDMVAEPDYFMGERLTISVDWERNIHCFGLAEQL